MYPDLNIGGSHNEAVEDVKKGLEAALYEEGIQVTDDSEGGLSPDNIKIQKLVYRIAEDWEIPLIRTWYRYGQFEPYNTLRPSEFSPSPLEELDRPVRSGKFGTVTREDIQGYYAETNLDEVWSQPMFDFLEENYQDWAPEEYRDLYLSNLEVLNTLEDILECDDEELATNAGDFITDMKSATLDLRYHMRSQERFTDDVLTHTVSYLDSLQEALVKLESISDPDPMQLQALRRGYMIYHGYVWPWPAMIISIHKAKVPSNEEREFADKGERLLTKFEETMPGQLKGWKEELQNVNLTPSVSQYQSVRGPSSSTFRDLEKGIMIKAGDE